MTIKTLAANSAFARYCSGFGIPRSAKTLPLLGMIVSFCILLLFIQSPIFVGRIFQTAFNKINIRLWSCYPFGRFLLKGVQNIDGFRKSHCVHATISLVIVISDHFQHTCTTKTLQGLGKRSFLTYLSQIEGETDFTPRNLWKVSQIVLGPSYPSDGPDAGLTFIAQLSLFWDKSQSEIQVVPALCRCNAWPTAKTWKKTFSLHGARGLLE